VTVLQTGDFRRARQTPWPVSQLRIVELIRPAGTQVDNIKCVCSRVAIEDGVDLVPVGPRFGVTFDAAVWPRPRNARR